MYIGTKKISDSKEEDNLVEVTYEDDSRETLSKLMFDAIVSDEACDLTKLRDKRIERVVAEVLLVLRNWGIKLSELPYLSQMLNRSLEYNEKAALMELWKQWIPTIQSPDDVDLIAVDKILKSQIVRK